MAGNLQNGGSVWRPRSSSSCADAAVVMHRRHFNSCCQNFDTPLLFLFFPSFLEDFFGAKGNIITSTLQL